VAKIPGVKNATSFKNEGKHVGEVLVEKNVFDLITFQDGLIITNPDHIIVV